MGRQTRCGSQYCRHRAHGVHQDALPQRNDDAMTIRLDELPDLIVECRRALKSEAADLKSHTEDFANNPRPGCMAKTDGEARKNASDHTHRAGRRRLMQHGWNRDASCT